MIMPKNVKNTPDRVRQRGTTRVAFANGLTTGSMILVVLDLTEPSDLSEVRCLLHFLL